MKLDQLLTEYEFRTATEEMLDLLVNTEGIETVSSSIKDGYDLRGYLEVYRERGGFNFPMWDISFDEVDWDEILKQLRANEDEL
jgi:hypothetical protein